MKRPFFNIVNEKLELSDLANDDLKPVIFDINADYDGSASELATYIVRNNLSQIETSSSIDYSDEEGIDREMLTSFFDTVQEKRFLLDYYRPNRSFIRKAKIIYHS
tara:strand:- start:276 stop:593 length:318 start_codon:yes stop_codon:yes gene_type:complete